MTTNTSSNRLDTVRVSRTVPCPPSCEWHGTSVLHARHQELVEADVVTLEEACRRLGVSPKYDWEGLKQSKVAFNDRSCQNHHVGTSKALFSFVGVHQEKWGFTLTSTSYAVVETAEGAVEACVVA